MRSNRRATLNLVLQIFWASLCVFALSSCSRKAGETATVSIQLGTGAGAQKNANASSYTGDRKACYGVSISGPGITPSVNSCSPPLGIVAGYVALGGTLSASVPYGSNRQIQLFLYLQREGENNPCPEMGAVFSKEQLSQTYLVATASNLNFSQPSVNVSMTERFPGLTQTIASQFTLPRSCLPVASAPARPGFRISTGSGYASGSGVLLLGKVGRPTFGQEMTGTGIVLRARLTGGN